MSRQAVAPYTRPSSPSAKRSATKARQRQPRSAGNWTMVVLLLLFLAVAAGLFLPTSIVLGAAMIPSLVALMVDQDPDKLGTITVAPINFCGALPTAMSLWSSNNTVPHALHLLSEPLAWLIMYGAAAIGWVLYFVIPPIISSFVVRRHQAEITRLTEHQEKLVAEWGADVAGSALQANNAD